MSPTAQGPRKTIALFGRQRMGVHVGESIFEDEVPVRHRDINHNFSKGPLHFSTASYTL